MTSARRSLTRSATRPETILSRLVPPSASPSIRPARASGVLSTCTKKIRRSGMIISLDMSVKSETPPSTSTVRVMPPSQPRFAGGASGSRVSASAASGGGATGVGGETTEAVSVRAAVSVGRRGFWRSFRFIVVRSPIDGGHPPRGVEALYDAMADIGDIDVGAGVARQRAHLLELARLVSLRPDAAAGAGAQAEEVGALAADVGEQQAAIRVGEHHGVV